jgi:hypothetical protein
MKVERQIEVEGEEGEGYRTATQCEAGGKGWRHLIPIVRIKWPLKFDLVLSCSKSKLA